MNKLKFWFIASTVTLKTSYNISPSFILIYWLFYDLILFQYFRLLLLLYHDLITLLQNRIMDGLLFVSHFAELSHIKLTKWCFLWIFCAFYLWTMTMIMHIIAITAITMVGWRHWHTLTCNRLMLSIDNFWKGGTLLFFGFQIFILCQIKITLILEIFYIFFTYSLTYFYYFSDSIVFFLWILLRMSASLTLRTLILGLKLWFNEELLLDLSINSC